MRASMEATVSRRARSVAYRSLHIVKVGSWETCQSTPANEASARCTIGQFFMVAASHWASLSAPSARRFGRS